MPSLGDSFRQAYEAKRDELAQGKQAPQQVTRTYTGDKAMRNGIEQMARKGWQVVSNTSYQPARLLFKPKVKFVVVFARAR
jgi:hypothetical protein